MFIVLTTQNPAFLFKGERLFGIVELSNASLIIEPQRVLSADHRHDAFGDSRVQTRCVRRVVRHHAQHGLADVWIFWIERLDDQLAHEPLFVIKVPAIRPFDKDLAVVAIEANLGRRQLTDW